MVVSPRMIRKTPPDTYSPWGWYHSTTQVIFDTWHIQPVPVNGVTQYTEQCSGVDPTPSSPGEGLAPWQIQPVWLNGTTPRHVIPIGVEESTQVADFTLRWYFLLRGGFLHSACAQGLNDRRFWFGCYKYKRTTIPALRAGWRQIAAATPGVPCFG